MYHDTQGFRNIYTLDGRFINFNVEIVPILLEFFMGSNQHTLSLTSNQTKFIGNHAVRNIHKIII